MPDEIELSRSAIKLANRQSKARIRAANLRAKLAKNAARTAKIEARDVKLGAKVEKQERELALASSGMKRSWLTGRVIPVKASRDGRNKAHAARRWFGRKAAPAVPAGAILEE